MRRKAFDSLSTRPRKIAPFDTLLLCPPPRAASLSLCLPVSPILQEQESDDDDDDDTATTSHMTDATAPADGAKKDKKAAPRAALDALLAGEAAIIPQVSVASSS